VARRSKKAKFPYYEFQLPDGREKSEITHSAFIFENTSLVKSYG